MQSASQLRFALATCLLAGASHAQSPYATQVVQYVQGSGGGLFDPAKILGAPLGAGTGGGSLDVLTLGDAGSVTLAFDRVLRDRPGADLAVFENGFIVGGGPNVFAELAHVEVSSDGTNFARFPSCYAPPAGGGNPIGTAAYLCGGTPVLANEQAQPGSGLDPARSGGEALDLALLAQDPLVLSGAVDLQALNYVRLVDVAGGDLDAKGQPISGGASADIDAVALLHHDGQGEDRPVCDLFLDAQGHARLRLGDPDGIGDLDLSSLSASWSLQSLPLSTLLSLFQVASFDGQVLELVSPVPIAGTGMTATLAVSVRDLAGALTGDQLPLQG